MHNAEPAFGTYAARYDAGFTDTAVGRRLRNRVWRYLEKHLDPHRHPRVLEINCGTGEDAVWLAQRGFDVTATDASAEMTAVAEKKAAAKHVALRTMNARFEDLGEKFPAGSFDVIFSDFGGLNCIDAGTLHAVAGSIAALLKPGGRFIAVVMSRDCPWERRYFMHKKKPAEAKRRLRKDGVPMTIEGHTFHTWYYTTKEFTAALGPEFSALRKRPVGWLLPPSYLDPAFRKRRMALAFLDAMERLCGLPLFADQADHFLIDFVRR